MGHCRCFEPLISLDSDRIGFSKCLHKQDFGNANKIIEPFSNYPRITVRVWDSETASHYKATESRGPTDNR